MNPLLSEQEDKTILAMGNEAIARGALEAGLAYFSMYPGTPASEIGMTLDELKTDVPGLYTEYSQNEHVSLHGAIGASWSGVRAMVAMKHVGLNVAAEPAHFLGYTGVKAGLVIVIGSDPGATSSTGEQDDRWYSLHTHMPLCEPSTIQEAKDFTRAAFELSEEFNTAVMLNASSRLCHNIGNLTLGPMPQRPQEKHRFERNFLRYFNLFDQAVANHRTFLESMDRFRDHTYSSPLNKVLQGTAQCGIVTSGIHYTYVLEALDLLEIYDVPILKLGITYPVSDRLFAEFAQGLKEVIVVEDLEGFMEFQLKRIAFEHKLTLDIVGKEVFPPWGEVDLDMVLVALAEQLGCSPPSEVVASLRKAKEIEASIPPRTAAFCAGCPHRATVYALLRATGPETIRAGDIGCYTMASLPPFYAADWCTCMNCGLAIAQGITRMTEDQTVVALVGDSTLFHSGIPSLLNAIEKDADVLLLVLDNHWIAMTGHQSSPTTVRTVDGKPMRAVNLKDLARVLGARYVRRVNCFDTRGTAAAISDAMARRGLKIIVADGECALQTERRKRHMPAHYKEYFEIERERCQKCEECYAMFSCPAIQMSADEEEEYYYIDEDVCTRCGACKTVCPNSAITKVEVNKYAFSRV